METRQYTHWTLDTGHTAGGGGGGGGVGLRGMEWTRLLRGGFTRRCAVVSVPGASSS